MCCSNTIILKLDFYLWLLQALKPAELGHSHCFYICNSETHSDCLKSEMLLTWNPYQTWHPSRVPTLAFWVHPLTLQFALLTVWPHQWDEKVRNTGLTKALLLNHSAFTLGAFGSYWTSEAAKTLRITFQKLCPSHGKLSFSSYLHTTYSSLPKNPFCGKIHFNI